MSEEITVGDRWVGVQDCVGAIFFYLQANRFSLHSFVDSVRRHEAPESKTKTFIIHGTTRSRTAVYFPQFPFPPSPREAMRGPQKDAIQQSLL